MEFSDSVGFITFMLIMVGMAWYFFSSVFEIFFTSSSQQFSSVFFPLKPEYKKILETKFPYYQQLKTNNRRKFEFRLKYFLKDKNFYGRENLQVTDEMRILIGASAVQITFGFQAMQLPHFNKIILYPHAYYSKHTKRKHKGEVNSAGVIVFSWEDFLKGYQVPDDGFNVGLHEMAHAVKIEDFIPNEEYSFLDEKTLMQWQNLTVREMKRIRTGENKFLRSYAGTNREEFFAVCVEQFFEKPEAFRRELPEVYSLLAALLQQDPLEIEEEE